MLLDTRFQSQVESNQSKMVFDAGLLNTEHYNVRMMIKLSKPRKEQSPPLHLCFEVYEKGDFGSPSPVVTFDLDDDDDSHPNASG